MRDIGGSDSLKKKLFLIVGTVLILVILMVLYINKSYQTISFNGNKYSINQFLTIVHNGTTLSPDMKKKIWDKWVYNDDGVSKFKKEYRIALTSSSFPNLIWFLDYAEDSDAKTYLFDEASDNFYLEVDNILLLMESGE